MAEMAGADLRREVVRRQLGQLFGRVRVHRNELREKRQRWRLVPQTNTLAFKSVPARLSGVLLRLCVPL
jgi:hypothetical protein